MILRHRPPSDWRNYQRRLRREARIRALWNRLPWFALLSAGIIGMLFVISYAGSRLMLLASRASYEPVKEEKKPPVRDETLSKNDLSHLLSTVGIGAAVGPGSFVLEKNGKRLTAESTVDPDLQGYISRLLRRSMTLQAAVVVLRPSDGRILALASHETEGQQGVNLCLQADFPAASLFKIISAAAALESAGFTPDQTMLFRGRRHTLYKSQLREKTGRYVNKTSLRRAFASSINPVFGRLGIYHLGPSVMKEYSDHFLFNQFIPFELPLEMSTIEIPADDFGLAEIASGFNKRTLISPIHAALLSCAVANNGQVMTPWIVRSVADENGNLLYEAHPSILGSPISPKTAEEMKVLMRDTVVYGTCRKTLAKLGRKRQFKNVELGAKTGTINDPTDRFKYDWLSAYALPGERSKGICIAVMGIHGEILGIRANELGRAIIQYHLSS